MQSVQVLRYNQYIAHSSENLINKQFGMVPFEKAKKHLRLLGQVAPSKSFLEKRGWGTLIWGLCHKMEEYGNIFGVPHCVHNCSSSFGFRLLIAASHWISNATGLL